jgi:hypothetical protein
MSDKLVKTNTGVEAVDDFSKLLSEALDVDKVKSTGRELAVRTSNPWEEIGEELQISMQIKNTSDVNLTWAVTVIGKSVL